MNTDKFPGHEGHNVQPLPMTRAGLYKFSCVDCCDIFAVTFNAIDSTPEDKPYPLVYKVSGECPKCEEPVLHWVVCEPELCEDCSEQEGF